MPEHMFDRDRTAARMGRTSTGPHEVREVPVHSAEQSYRPDAPSIGEKRATQRRSEHLETAAHGACASNECDSARNHEEITGDPLPRDSSDVSSAIKMVEELNQKVRLAQRQKVRQ